MCGRFAQTKELAVLINRFHFIIEDLEIRKHYNIAPGQDSPVIILENKQRKLKMMRWGLVPFWSKEFPKAARRINARSETAAQKPGFRHSFKNRRCLVPSSGYYEWKELPGVKTKVPYFISLKNKAPFAFAGLWDAWENPEKEILLSFSIITTTANSLTRAIHPRMPVILSPEKEDLWIEPDFKDTQTLGSFLKPYPSKNMEAYEVSPLVNSPKHDSPECLKKASYPRQGLLFT